MRSNTISSAQPLGLDDRSDISSRRRCFSFVPGCRRCRAVPREAYLRSLLMTQPTSTDADSGEHAVREVEAAMANAQTEAQLIKVATEAAEIKDPTQKRSCSVTPPSCSRNRAYKTRRNMI